MRSTRFGFPHIADERSVRSRVPRARLGRTASTNLVWSVTPDAKSVFLARPNLRRFHEGNVEAARRYPKTVFSNGLLKGGGLTPVRRMRRNDEVRDFAIATLFSLV